MITTPVFQTKKLTIGYFTGRSKQRALLSDLDLQGMGGEIIAVIGRNGIGKSTLLKTLTGLLRPLSGEIDIGGRQLQHIRRSELATLIGYVSTEGIFIPNLTVTALVSYGRFPYTGFLGRLGPDDSAAVKRAIEQVGIGHIAGKPVDEISDGERQKAMIARALAQDTKVIILDEPTAFLDLPNRFVILRLLNELAYKRGKTIIFSTHDLGIALQEVDKIWLLDEDDVLTGAPEDLIITKGFHKLFRNSDFQFDTAEGQFRLLRKPHRYVTIEGEGRVKYWTVKALERIGIGISDLQTLAKVTAGEENNKPFWKLFLQDSEKEFDSIYTLMSYLKTITN